MLALVGQERLDKIAIVVVYDDACLLSILLNRGCVEFGSGDAVESDGTKAANSTNLVKVSTARDSSYQ